MNDFTNEPSTANRCGGRVRYDDGTKQMLVWYDPANMFSTTFANT